MNLRLPDGRLGMETKSDEAKLKRRKSRTGQDVADMHPPSPSSTPNTQDLQKVPRLPSRSQHLSLILLLNFELTSSLFQPQSPSVLSSLRLHLTWVFVFSLSCFLFFG